MLTFTKQHTISAVKRLTYSGGKGTRGTVSGATYSCYLKPISIQEAAVNGMQWGTAYIVILDVGSNVLVNDVITISSQDYTVQGIATYSHGSMVRRTDYMKLLVSKAQA